MNEPVRYKIALLGDSLVGKTCFFRKLDKGIFSDSLPTIGIDAITLFFNDIKIEDNVTKNFEITLVDTAGQERYKSIIKQYYINSDALILMYDIAKYDSFENLQIWLDSIQEYYDDLNLVMLLGNKLDLEENREVRKEQPESLLKEKGLYPGGEISAKTFSLEKCRNIIIDFVKHIYSKIGIIKERQSNYLEVSPKENNVKKKNKCC